MRARYTDSMLALPLDVALTVLVAACALMSVQLILLTVAIDALRRDVRTLLRVIVARRVRVADSTPTNPTGSIKKKRPQPD